MSDFERCSQAFVYGTLRRSGSNHWRMDGAEFVGETSLRGRLYRVDWYPGLVLDSEAGEVFGEVFTLSGVEQLQMLDDYEGQEYQRMLVQTSCGPAWCWEFIRSCEGLEQLASGRWES